MCLFHQGGQIKELYFKILCVMKGKKFIGVNDHKALMTRLY